MRTLSIVGARPQFIKLAPVSRAMHKLERHGIEDIILHTGQHYDDDMSKVFFDELKIPQPKINLEVGSGSHGAQTGKMLELIEQAIESTRPDIVITYGDTNSTVAGSLAAAKLHVPVAHIEAGLRSFDRQMPEEVNRIMTDHISDLLFAPTLVAQKNLEMENLGDRTYMVGDVMLDAVLFNTKLAENSRILERLGLADTRYAVATIHRASNTDTARLEVLLGALNRVAASGLEVVFPVHPRTVARIKSSVPGWKSDDKLRLIEPVGYLDMLALLSNASMAMTDSGGLQKEAFFVGTPCITLRSDTEWTETVDAGANVLVGADQEAIVEQTSRILGSDFDREEIRRSARSLYGEGVAAEKVVDQIAAFGAASQ